MLLVRTYLHAKEWGMPIVFCVMGPPWVVDEFPFSISRVLLNLAMIGHDWREFGMLPEYEVGLWHEDLYQTQRRREESSSKEFSFDPSQYLPKSKKRTPKNIKPKSTKPRFSKDSEDDYHPSGEFERKE